MTQPTPASVHLFFTDATSNKEYKLELLEREGGWEVMAHYGKRGSALKPVSRTKGVVSFEAARKEFDKTEKSKRKEGYTEDESGAPVYPAPERVMLTSALASTFAEEFCDGYRRPQLAWAHGDVGILTEVGCDCVFVNVWVGSPGALEAFAHDLAADAARKLSSIQQPSPDSKFENIETDTFVAYWAPEGHAEAMVASFTVCEALATWCAPSEEVVLEDFPSVRKYKRFFTQVGFDGNDTDPYTVLQEIVGLAEEGVMSKALAKKRIDLVAACANIDEEGIQEIMEEFEVAES